MTTHLLRALTVVLTENRQGFFTYAFVKACLSESFDVEKRTFKMVTTSDNI